MTPTPNPKPTPPPEPPDRPDRPERPVRPDRPGPGPHPDQELPETPVGQPHSEN
jgi:hypothetical protein